MFTPLYNNFEKLFLDASPIIYLILILLSSFRLIYLIYKKREFIIYKEIINLFFLLYFVSLFYIVTAQDINLYSGNNYTPFREINRYKIMTYPYLKNVVGNIVLFIPYGYLICKYLKTKNILINFLMVVLASLSIEITQLSIGRVFDIDDIILNVVGGLIGYFLYVIFQNIFNILPNSLKNRRVLDIIFLIIFGLMSYFILIIHF